MALIIEMAPNGATRPRDPGRARAVERLDVCAGGSTMGACGGDSR